MHAKKAACTSRKNKNLVTLATSCFSCLKNSRVSICLKRQERQETTRKTRILSLLQHPVIPVKNNRVSVCLKHVCMSKKDRSDRRQQENKNLVTLAISCYSCQKTAVCLYVKKRQEKQEKQESCHSCNILLLLSKNSRVSVSPKKDRSDRRQKEKTRIL